jgi:hypothetical protein
MAKRFCSTDIWGEDWFLEMPIGYKLFWNYMLASCNHAGLFKVNLRSFCGLNEVKIEADQALQFFNNGKDRIRVVNQSLWLVEDFFVFQYGPKFNPNNRVHLSIKNELEKNGVNLTSIRGLIEDRDRVKDKDKDKDKDIIELDETLNTENMGEELFEEKTNITPVRKLFTKPTIADLTNQFVENGLDDFSAQGKAKLFFNHYETVGWKVGKNPMKNWKTAVAGWVTRDNQKSKNYGQHQKSTFQAGRDRPTDKF